MPELGTYGSVGAPGERSSGATRQVFREGLEELSKREREQKTLDRISQAVGGVLAELVDSQTTQLVRVGHAIKAELQVDHAEFESRVSGMLDRLSQGLLDLGHQVEQGVRHINGKFDRLEA